MLLIIAWLIDKYEGTFAELRSSGSDGECTNQLWTIFSIGLVSRISVGLSKLWGWQLHLGDIWQLGEFSGKRFWTRAGGSHQQQQQWGKIWRGEPPGNLLLLLLPPALPVLLRPLLVAGVLRVLLLTVGRVVRQRLLSSNFAGLVQETFSVSQKTFAIRF